MKPLNNIKKLLSRIRESLRGITGWKVWEPLRAVAGWKGWEPLRGVRGWKIWQPLRRIAGWKRLERWRRWPTRRSGNRRRQPMARTRWRST